MANLGNVKDGRPHVQDELVGYQLVNDLQGNDAEIKGVIQLIHNDDGTPNGRCFARLTGSYLFSAGSYVLQKQSPYTAYLPTSITPAAHVITMNFTTALPEATYDVQLTPFYTGPSTPATIHCDGAARTTTQLVIYPFVSGSSADLNGFSIDIKWG